jgi:hypothetical protein
VPAGGADQQGQAEQAVTGDHHGGEDGVAGQRLGLLAAADHQGDDERDLDDRDGHREDQGTERLADPVGDDLGVVDGGEHGRAEQQGDDHHQRRRQVAAPGQDQGGDGEDGDEVGPANLGQHPATLPDWNA